MRIPLFDFQEDAKDALLNKISVAHQLLNMEQGEQIITFSAPTGAGKTIIMTSLIEDILFGTTDFMAQPDAIFVWLSDMPDLNEQSRLKIETKSDKIQLRQLITIDSSFDKEYLESGNIYFINTQKLGTDKILTKRTDTHHYPFWETLTNTAIRNRNKLYVIIDEAHRGMNRGRTAENTAQTIMQKFILGSNSDGLSVMPLIIGITATPQKFQRMIADTPATKHTVTISPQNVIDSGLLKDRVIIHCPQVAMNAEMTMFQEAALSWKRMTDEWMEYQTVEPDKLVKPILVVQVNDRTDSIATTTDINTCLEVMEETIGRHLQIGEVVHTFNDEGTLNGFSIPIVKAEPEHIENDQDIIMVFFKMNLSTGWDCPRAEVMMSFRVAQDYTFVAQLLGRMVRTPLAHRIELNAELNAVHLFLPFFDKNTVEDVVNAFKDNENATPTEAGTDQELVTLSRNPLFSEVFEHMNDLVTYHIDGARTESNIRRLDKLTVLLASDGINRQMLRSVRVKMAQKIRDIITTIKEHENFDDIISNITGMNLSTLELEIATSQVVSNDMRELNVSVNDIEHLYKISEKQLGDYIAMQYRVEESPRDETEVKLELIVVASRINEMDTIDTYAGQVFDEVYNNCRREIQQLPIPNIEKYEKLISSGVSATALQWRAPFSIAFNYSENDDEYSNHLYIDSAEQFRAKLNLWEKGVLEEEINRPGFVTWLRNLDRKNWSIEIPYKISGMNKPMYPDLMIVRNDAHGFIFDLLEPHDSSRSDNYPKAKGLAEFAQKHGNHYGRIELIRKLSGADGKSHFYRLNLTNITIQRSVMAINSNEELDRIFDESAMTEE